MSNTHNYDAKVKAILDATAPGERTCAITGEKWMMTEEEIGWYKTFNCPPSIYAPLTRMKRFTVFFRGGQWWWNKHPKTGKPIISSVHPATGISVLPDKEWFNEDLSSHAAEFDVSRPFLDQLFDLRKRVPAMAHGNYVEPENSIAIASSGDVNSYFVVASKSKNTFFSVVALNTENSSEVYNSESVTDSYQVIHCERVHGCQYVRESKDCLGSFFLFDCRNCEYVFGGSNLRNKKYVWFNEQLSREEWERRRAEVNTASRSAMQPYRDQFEMLVRAAVWPENFNSKSESSVGEYLTNCEQSKYVFYADGGAKNNYWIAWLIGNAEGNAFVADPSRSQNCYNSAAVASSNACQHSVWLTRCQSCEFCTDCFDCENCFGCVGLRKQKFCILNKQYSEEEYWRRVDEMKCALLDRGEYADGMPPRFSVGWFMESGSVKYYGSDKAFGEKVGAHLFDSEQSGAYGDELMAAREIRDVSTIPDDAKDLDGWAGVALFDPVFKRRYAFLAPEIAFYQKQNVAPPNKHFIARTIDYIRLSNVPIFEEHACVECGKVLTVAKNFTYPDRKICCSHDYLKFLESR